MYFFSVAVVLLQLLCLLMNSKKQNISAQIAKHLSERSSFGYEYFTAVHFDKSKL